MTDITASATNHDAKDLGKKVIRFGWVAKGFVYAVLALLTFEVVFAPSGGSSQASSQGVIQRIAEQPFGRILLIVLAAGLIAYSLGRLAEATFLADEDDEWYDRLGYLRSAVFYGFIAVLAIAQVAGSGGSGGGGSQTASWTADLMSATGGRWLVGLVGLAIVGFGVWYAYRGVSQQFMDDLNTGEMDDDTRTTARWLGTSGMVGRGLSFGLVGAFVALAALQFDPDKAKGLDKALAEIADTSWGPFVIVVLGVGLAAYAAYCLFEARYRDLSA